MNTIEPNPWAPKWELLGKQLHSRVRAVLCISAHWFTSGTGVTFMSTPRTIHDFGGFPDELFRFQYPAPGEPALATRVAELLAPLQVMMDTHWGLDHGTWSVLAHVFPEADIPIIQLSIDGTQPGAFHYELGRKLAVLREEGVLILGSGNIVHNLRATFSAPGGLDAEPFDWTLDFDDKVRTFLAERDDAALFNYDELGHGAKLSIPTPEHYLPLLYVLGAAEQSEQLTFPAEGFQGAALSMLAVAFS